MMFYALIAWPEARGDGEALVRVSVMRGAVEAIVRYDVDASIRQLDDAERLATRIGNDALLGFVLSSRAWIRMWLGQRFDDCLGDLQRAIALADRRGMAWVRADAQCGAMIVDAVQGRFDDARRTATSMLGSDVARAFPFAEVLSSEVLAAVAMMTGRYADAAVAYERASEGLERGWAWLVDVGHMEALCCLADTERSLPTPHLVWSLRRAARRAHRVQGRVPIYRGVRDSTKAVVDSRSGRWDRAQRGFANTVKQRPYLAPGEALPTGVTYMDAWALVRRTLEEHRAGADREVTRAELDRVDAIYRAVQVRGMQEWLAGLRTQLGV